MLVPCIRPTYCLASLYFCTAERSNEKVFWLKEREFLQLAKEARGLCDSCSMLRCLIAP